MKSYKIVLLRIIKKDKKYKKFVHIKKKQYLCKLNMDL